MDQREEELHEMVAAERSDLAEMLAGLPVRDWDAPSLCAGWRVRDVVAHMTMPFRMSVGAFLFGMVKAGFRFNRMSDTIARRDGSAFGPAELTAAVADNVRHPWKPPGGGFTGALSHDVIHGLDITTALGLDRKVPIERVAAVLDGPNIERGLRYFGVDLSGVRLVADDLDWTLGEGDPVSGAGQDVLLAVSGRRLPPGRLTGAQASRFTA